VFALETLADLKHQERLAHAARLQMVARARGPQDHYLDREAHRRITVRRLTAAATAVALAATVAAGALALDRPAAHQLSGGGVTRSR
jgi:phosphoglycerate dehydrogenase-like enzyme